MNNELLLQLPTAINKLGAQFGNARGCGDNFEVFVKLFGLSSIIEFTKHSKVTEVSLTTSTTGGLVVRKEQINNKDLNVNSICECIKTHMGRVTNNI